MRIIVTAALIGLATVPAARAQTTPDDSFHAEILPDIVVTAPFRRSRADLLQGTSVVTGIELARDLRGTVGETLARQPGVSATSFGPNASRPVLRGLQGERVRVLTDGIGAFDASNTSVDHAVAINPLLAERVEVLRGPAALLFGSSAIGGVVNVIDRRIPRAVPDEVVHVEALGGYGSAADEWFAGGSLDVPIAGKLVAHVDGSYRDSGDLEVGGFVLSRERRDLARANGADDAAELRGKLANTAAEFKDFAGGLALIDERGQLGVAVSRLENRYGVPIRVPVEPDGEAEAVLLDIEQTRADARALVEMGGAFEELRLRFGYADYEHAEIDVETGETGTRFFNEALEARLELAQAARGVWRAAYGAQFLHRDFNVIGDEAFVPANVTDQLGLFTLHTFELGAVRAELGGRYENSRVRSRDPFFPGGSVDYRRSFDVWSASAGASYGLGGDWRVGLNLSRTERAPAAEELLANGPHAGTQAFEIGGPDFGSEVSKGVEATLRGGGAGYSVAVSGYYNRFDDYIELTPTGEVADDLPVFQFFQSDARFYGFEAEASVVLARVGGFDVAVDGVADYTHARIAGFGPAPRIPPLRLRGGVEARQDAWVARAEVEWSAKQDRIADFETETRDFTLVGASVAWRPFGADSATSLVLSASNLLDVNARRHASFAKDYAPLAGRDVRLSARVGF